MTDRERILVVFRIHYWDDAVGFAFDTLRAATSAEILICADETNGPVDTPAGAAKLSHTVDTFAAMGLPLLPSPQHALWFCSDYPLFQLLGERDFDTVFMIEGDATATGGLDGLFAKLHAEGVDYAARDFKRQSRLKRHQLAASEWFGARHLVKDVWSGCFPSVFLSRRAIEALRAERFAMAEALRERFVEWIYCETFVATCLKLGGFRCRALNDFADLSRSAWENPVRPEDVTTAPDGMVRIFHPVLNSPRFEMKLISHLKRRERLFDQRKAELQRMTRQLAEARGSLDDAAAKLSAQARTIRRLRKERDKVRAEAAELREAALGRRLKRRLAQAAAVVLPWRARKRRS